MPLARRFAFLTDGCPEDEGAHNRRVVARSFFRLVYMTCGSGPRVIRWDPWCTPGETSPVTLQRREWEDLPLKRGRSPGSRHASLFLRPSRPFAFRASRWGAPVFSRGIHARAVPSGDFTVGERVLVVVSLVLSSSCCRWRGATPWELASFHHHSASRIFITQPGRNLRPVVIRKDDYQPCGGEKRVGLRPPPALSFKDVHHPCWGGGQAEWELCLPHGLAARFFLQHSRERGVRQPCGGGELWVRGAGHLWRCQLPRVWLLGLGGSSTAFGAAFCRWGGAWLPIHRTGDGRAVRGLATSTASPVLPAALGGCTRRRTPRGRQRRSWMVLSSLQ
jgi:hypothetical protein